MIASIKPCPFCLGDPHFNGDGDNWQDESRYVEMSLVCCVTMPQAIGWLRAREMTKKQREDELKKRLTDAWNHRASSEVGGAA